VAEPKPGEVRTADDAPGAWAEVSEVSLAAARADEDGRFSFALPLNHADTDPAGRFRLENLPAWSRRFHLSGVPCRDDDAPRFPAEVRDGGTTTVTWRP
jgi:hypothetical protein